jgi:iron complex outermembrane recepter protein
MQTSLLKFGRALQKKAGRAFRFNLFLANNFFLKTKKSPFAKKRISTSIPHAGQFFVIGVLLSTQSHFSQQIPDSTKTNQLNEVMVSAIRATSKTPMSFSNLSKKEFQSRNLGQDIPILLNFLPSVISTSDAGNGVGYTGIRVRGSDATRINVTINGIPYNDSESHGTFWVNMPDFASSVENLQLQRGVGTSTNGSGAFGASLNLLTDNPKTQPLAEISNSIGSFNTQKHTLKFSTGLLNNHFELAGRLSKITSNGYIDRATSNLKSYFLQGTFVDKKATIKALVFGGTEKTYQSWNGIDAETLAKNRTFNSAGQYTDEFGNTRFYDNETDNYQQDHFQLHWNQKINQNWDTNLAIHYTKGKGYFENYKENARFVDYNLTPITIGSALINETDLVRQKWLENDFYGTTFSVNYKNEKTDFVFGGAINKYEGQHFGKVIWARFASTSEIGDKYYDDQATKTDANFFAKTSYQISKKLSLYGDLQFRNVNYKANGEETGLVNDNFIFFNPKAGLNFDLNTHNNFYFSYAKAQREPNRTDYETGSPKPEKLDDFELGFRHNTKRFIINANLYYMFYTDQLILTGALDGVGNPIRSNSEKSYRLGLEVDATINIIKQIYLKPNFTISESRNNNLAVGNEFIGNKKTAYSPQLIAGNMLVFLPTKKIQVAVLTKFVGHQFMNNTELEAAKLPDYSVFDLNFTYDLKPKTILKNATFNALINNVFNKKYVSNGYMYDIYPYYYPQAGINFLVGINLGI